MTAPPPLPSQRPLSPLAYCLLVPGMLAGLVIVIALGLRVFGYVAPFQVPSSGMAPTLCKGDRVLGEAISLASRSIRRGEIVFFDSGQVPALRSMPAFSGVWAYRVVALPGDRFQLKDGQVWINGAPSAELRDYKYIATPSNQQGLDLTREILIPEGQCVVLGDNTHNSLDSRYWGFLPVKSVKYVYACHYWKSADRSLTPPRH